MTKKIGIGLTLAFIISFAITTRGQENKKKLKDSTRHWEVGLDLLWLINKNQVPATSIFFRYNFQDKQQRHKAWRVRLGFDTNNLDSVQIAGKDIKIDKISPYLRSGFEWQKVISSHFGYFYGTDISVNYTYTKDSRLYNIFPSNDRVLSESKDKSWLFGAHGFFGIMYRPIKWFSISSETSINFIYQIREFRLTSVDPANPQIAYSGTSGFDSNSVRTSINPISVLNICFTLN